MDLIGIPYVCQFILDRGLFAGALSESLHIKIHDAQKVGLDRDKMGFRTLQTNKQLVTTLFRKADLIPEESIVKDYELERVGEE
jgi:hypothetical protein